MHQHEVGLPIPQGSSLLPELCCLEPSSLNRPHPPHSWAHRDFTARRLIRDVFAVRERLSDPRVAPGFRWLFRLDMPSSMTPGSSIIVIVQFSDVDIGLRRDLSGSALPKFPQSASRGARISGLPGLRYVAACQVARPPVTDRTGSEGFYFQAFGRSVALAAAGYNYSMDWTPCAGGTFTRWNSS